MQVFNAFLKVLRKKMPVAMILIIIFLIISIIFVKTNNSTFTFEEKRFSICVLDEDQTPESKALTAFLGERHELISLPAEDEEEILDALYYERADYVMTIPAGYAEKLASGKTDTLFTHYYIDDRYANTLLDSTLSEYICTVSAYQASGMSCTEAITAAENALSEEIEVNSNPFVKTEAENNKYSNFSYYFQYLPYVLLSVMIAALSPTLITMQKADIRHRTNCSCLSSSSQTLQLMLGSGLFVLFVWLIFMIAGIFISGEMFHGMTWYAVLNSFVFQLVAAGIAILISTFAPSSTGVNVISNIVGLGMSFLCGVFVPQSLLGEGILQVGQFLPAYWYIKANNMLSGTSGEVFTTVQFLQYVGIEFLFAVALFAVTLVLQKAKHDVRSKSTAF
ncbi:MAG: ABC transporter permease [Oscillospiraceae bacterium]|nr:ABC transporter permease [Oscillospiraceae bacterium]